MNISPQTWRKISELLETAMELSAAERAAWLQTLPSTLAPDELSVLEPLKKLLAQEARIETDDILRAAPDFASALAADTTQSAVGLDLSIGAEIGGYRLIRELGQGGMGSVWLAEQVDGRLQRTVALKVPYAGPQQRELARRFIQERDILAKLEHPNIARLYDADAANPDRPFLVLEYVDGVPIDEYCRTRRLPVPDRLRLFRQVFEAVQYAHTRLVIHRDLKPSNILVTSEGVVRLLDFGIAKVLAKDNEAPALTEVGSVVLTPSFASPEQITGAELTTASDVYALGVVLYELLTGARPYQVKNEGRRALEDAIVLADVVTPSSAALTGSSDLDRKQLAKELQGDLDTILLKSLKKRPAERYPTVAAFADDIDRYLRGEPVQARADSAWYRLRRFAGRNRLAVAASLAVIASLGIGLSVALWQLHAARVAQKRAEDVKEFIASIFRSADPFFTGNRSMSAADLLALARTRIDRELQNQPVSAMELLNIVGESQLNLTEMAAARATIEKAIALGTATLPSDDPLTAMARSRLASFHVQNQDLASAKPLLAQAIPILRTGGRASARELANALTVQAYIHTDEGNSDAAVADAREAYEIVRDALGPNDSETILAKRQWAQELLYAGRLEDALPLAKQAYEESKALIGAGPGNALLIQTEGFYGRLLVESDDVATGIEHLGNVIELATQLFGPRSPFLANNLSHLLRGQLRLGDLKGTVATATKTFEATEGERAAARPLVNLGDTYLRARDLAQAESVLRRAVAATKQYDKSKGSWLPVAQGMYATTLLYLGRNAEAEALLRENLKLVGDSKDALTMPHWHAVGLAHAMNGEWVASEQGYRRLFERTTDSVASARWRTIAWNGIGVSQLQRGSIREAIDSLREAERNARKAYVSVTPSLADAQVNLARAHLQTDRAADALPLIEAADKFWQTYDANSRWAGEAAYWRARVLFAAGQVDDARQSFVRAERILQQSPVKSDIELATLARMAMRR